MWREYSASTMRLWLAGLAVMLLSPCIQAAEGGISLGQTRLIFGAERNSEKITLINQSDRVYLINSRVLRSPDSSAEPPDTVPFMVTPPLFRLESDSRNSVMVVRNDTSALPADRESVFYLSFLAIPAVSKPADDGMQPRVSVGIRSVIKLFYRPAALGMTVAEAPEKLMFTQQGEVLHAENPTPYYLTLAQLRVNGQVADISAPGAMIAPFSGMDYRITGTARDVSWSVINDYGGVSRTYQSALQGK